MYHPLPWHSTTRPGPEKGPGAVKYDLRVPLPDEHCQGTGFVHWKIKADCRFHLDNGKGWFSNYTRRDTALAPEATISRDMFDQWTLEKFEKRSLTNPWSAPGSAPIYGSCGTGLATNSIFFQFLSLSGKHYFLPFIKATPLSPSRTFELSPCAFLREQ